MIYSARKWLNSQLDNLKNDESENKTIDETGTSDLTKQQSISTFENQTVSISEEVIEPTNNYLNNKQAEKSEFKN